MIMSLLQSIVLAFLSIFITWKYFKRGPDWKDKTYWLVLGLTYIMLQAATTTLLGL